MKRFLIGITLFLLVVLGITKLFFSDAADVRVATTVTPLYESFPTSLNDPSVQLVTALLDRDATPAFASVLDTINLDIYAIYQCTENDVTRNMLLLVAKYKEIDGLNSYEPSVAAVREWEPYMVQDLGHIFFPNIDDALRSQTLTFTDDSQVDARHAEVSLKGSDGDLYYAWLANSLYISTSKWCLVDKVEMLYHDEEAH